MECQPDDSKKLFKVFDAAKLKRGRKKRDGAHDTNSIATDDSTLGGQHDLDRRATKTSLQDLPSVGLDGPQDGETVVVRRKASSPTISRSSREGRRHSRSPRRHARATRDGISLALKAGMASTPRSVTPPQKGNEVPESPNDQDSFIYAFLEEAVKRDKKKHRHSRRHEGRHDGREGRNESRNDGRSDGRNDGRSDGRNDGRSDGRNDGRSDGRNDGRSDGRNDGRSDGRNDGRSDGRNDGRSVCRTDGRRSSRELEQERSVSRERRHRHRRSRDDHSRDRDKEKQSPSLPIDQTMILETFAKLCAQMTTEKKSSSYSNSKEVERTQSHKSLQCEVASRDCYDDDRRRPKHVSPERSCHDLPPYRIRSSENCPQPPRHPNCYDQPKYTSKINVTPSRMRHDDERYRDRDYPDPIPPRSFIDYQNRPERERDYPREYERERRHYDDDKRRFGQTTSRSFEIQREVYDDRCRRTTRSDKNKHYDEKYYDKPEVQDRHFAKDRRRRNLERFERNSVVSRDDDYRDRDSGLSVADGETSTLSGRSNYLRVVKQEISEQREAMDKMMKLWKELMRCFKGISHTQAADNNKINESAENVRESAAAQLRLWRECMRRYETVARDVGDTDARLMEEINKQRSEMAEMANMWQECLQRYRDMSNDFNNLKQQLTTTSESPTRLPAPPLVCAEGEGLAPSPKYPQYPPNYPQMMNPVQGGMYPPPLRSRASAPPWWWGGAERPHEPESPRRRSSPDSRASSRRRHRHSDSRDDSRYNKEKSKPSAARSEHRHRKR